MEEGAHNVPVPPTPLEGQEAIEDRLVEAGETNGRGLELVGQELVIHRTIQAADPTNPEGLQVQSATAVTAMVTPARTSRRSPSASYHGSGRGHGRSWGD